MEARRRTGLPLSVKLILTTAVLLAIAVGAAGYFTLQTIGALAEKEAASRRTSGEAAMERQSELLARNAANSAALPLADGNFTYLSSLVDSIVKEDTRVQWMLIADAGSNRVAAKTAGAPAGDTLADPLLEKVLASPPNKAVIDRDPKDSTKFTFGMKVVVGDRVVGQLRLGVSTAELEAELQKSIAEARAQAAASAQNVIIIAAVILLVGIALGALQGVRMARPLNALAAQAHRIAAGDLDHRVEVSSRDEIGQLAQEFNFMADQLGLLLVETATKASLEREMSLARLVQESMIPSRQMIEHGPFKVMGYCEPAKECGGDWWTIRKLSGDRVLLAVGDVTGHGISSAMVAATARGAVEALAQVDERLMNPEQVLRSIDAAIRGVGTQQLLMTCFAALIDARAGTIEYSNAGHNFPYWLKVDPAGSVADLGVLALRGSPLGNIPGDFTLQSGKQQITTGDVFVFYTDGVIDRIDHNGNRFGDRRLRSMLINRSFPASGAGLSALRDEILGRMKSFAGTAPADDDVTLVLCQFDVPARAATRPRSQAHA
jgi:sigma-B regulation protein RsbU (phosphoserine phosphatase)